MKLYFSPLACSLATRIALYEAGTDAQFSEVDGRTKRTLDGEDFLSVHGLGLVPVLRTDDGQLIAENAAVLQYVADHFPAARLAPTAPAERSRLHQWLCFIGTELHKGIYVPLLDKNANESVKAYALQKVSSRLSWLASQLQGRDYLLGAYSVADPYLFAVLNWSVVTPVELAPWPTLTAFMQRMHARPAVASAFAQERGLFVSELQRHGEPMPALRATA